VLVSFSWRGDVQQLQQLVRLTDRPAVWQVPVTSRLVSTITFAVHDGADRQYQFRRLARFHLRERARRSVLCIPGAGDFGLSTTAVSWLYSQRALIAANCLRDKRQKSMLCGVKPWRDSLALSAAAARGHAALNHGLDSVESTQRVSASHRQVISPIVDNACSECSHFQSVQR